MGWSPRGEDFIVLHHVIMAGGSGTRFWPHSRRAMPKQFLSLTGSETLIQAAHHRMRGLIGPEASWVVTNVAHAAEAARQLPAIPADQILIEPCGRNTAPCIGLAAIHLLKQDPDAVMLVTPSDHVIGTSEQFQQAVRDAVALIERRPETFVLFGVKPAYPATGFGYIERGAAVTGSTAGVYEVQRFREKPDQATATEYLASGRFYWNCGIFVWRADAVLAAIRTFEPALYGRLEALQATLGTPAAEDSLATEFPQMPSISVDYAVLERAEDVCVLEAPFDWDDVGSWQAVARHWSADSAGNATEGLVATVDTQNCVIRTTDDHLVATIGVSDQIIVHTPTATLVADRRDENALRKLVDELQRRGLETYL